MSGIDIKGLTRTFIKGTSEVAALREINLSVPAGEVHGLLGPNGAGKTTLCRILSTVLLPTSGVVRVSGHDVTTHAAQVKLSIGIVFGGDRGLYERLTTRQNLDFWAALYGLSASARSRRVDALLERVGLSERARDKAHTLSRGMKQRLHLARGLVSEPAVLILDEPTVGMDPVSARDFRTLVRELRTGGRTILMTTHDMAEAAALSDRVSLIDHGRLVLTERPDAVGSWVTSHERLDVRGVPEPVQADLIAARGVLSVTDLDAGQRGALRIETENTEATRAVLRRLVEAGVTEIAFSRPDLEEVYLHLVGSRGMAVDG
ncbi:ABC transporter ATP-binding protein [Nonomuraea sp. NPDC051941]|uniref:ABC transporter ATP-binding protein n=1 Tax=Nonomuraea sp. NPDC051941 TaxID=3364373 RepID=UPI0037CA5448